VRLKLNGVVENERNKMMKPETCSNCEDSELKKVIYFGMPGVFCLNCNTLYGIASYMPIVVSQDEMGEPCFSFMIYEGSYWKALWTWLMGDQDNG